jgi:hypothetical protein
MSASIGTGELAPDQDTRVGDPKLALRDPLSMNPRSTFTFTADPPGSDHRGPDGPLALNEPLVVKVPLIVESAVATLANQPVTVGVPFPRGVLADGLVPSLSDASGRGVPLQTTPLAHWPDGSAKWLLLDFICGPVAKGQETWSLELRDKQTPRFPHSEEQLRVDETERGIIVSTGSASFMLDRDVLAPIVQAEIDGAPILDSARSRTVLIDAKGRNCLPRIERSEIETRGPVRATVRFEGSFDGRRRDRCRFRARLSFFAGLSLVRVELTLHNPRRARHRGGLWDLGDPGSILFRDLSLQLALSGDGAQQIHWTEEVDGAVRATEASTFEIYQDSSGGENWSSRNHVNRYGQVPCQFRGYRVVQGTESRIGLRASPVVSARGAGGNVTVAIPEFWQQFPKAIDTQGQTLNLRLFPGQFGDLFELQGGEQKTHAAWLDFSRNDRSDIDSLKWSHGRARVHCTPEWYSRSKSIPHFVPASTDPADRFESYLSAVVEGPNSFFVRRELIDEYGWRNYGEVYADHEGQHYTGEPPVISHYNNQYDLVFGMLRQYLRSENTRWLELADPLARHVIDIDIYHTDRDKAAYNGGLFWHTNHYRDAATSTHRAYSRHNYEPGDPFGGGGPSSNHNYSTGLLHYYYLTGDPNARDVVVGLADWVVNMDDGKQSVLGVLDPAPTGHATYPGEPNYQGPCRGAGNSINALIDGWLLASRHAYLEKAESLIRRVAHPDDDIPGRDLLNVEQRWSYTVFLSSVSRYLSVKADEGQLDNMYAYARAVVLRYAEWMVNHERPYFDQADKLEFPNETWAAQEFRKANVLRSAAAYLEEPMRSTMLGRGAQLVERAWQDLTGFPSRHSSRAVALLLIEGCRNAWLSQDRVPSAPKFRSSVDFGEPEEFVPQKQKIISQMRTVGGCLMIFLRLADLRNLRKLRLKGYLNF